MFTVLQYAAAQILARQGSHGRIIEASSGSRKSGSWFPRKCRWWSEVDSNHWPPPRKGEALSRLSYRPGATVAKYSNSKGDYQRLMRVLGLRLLSRARYQCSN